LYRKRRSFVFFVNKREANETKITKRMTEQLSPKENTIMGL